MADCEISSGSASERFEGLEDAERVGMQLAEEVEERLVAAVLERPQADIGVGLAWPAGESFM